MSTTPAVQEHKLGILVMAGDLESALPLEHTEYTVSVTGVMASAAVAQRFGNPLSEPAELVYLFPLPHEGAITGFEFRLGSRRVTGKIEENERARKTYEEARESGRRAGLLEEHRPNLFSIHLANVLPGETIEARLQYSQRIKLEDGSFELVIPMGITPRYQDPSQPAEPEINPPVAAPGELTGSVAVTVSVDAGSAAADPESPSHPIEVTRQDPARFMVRLAGEHAADHDFVLHYDLASRDVQATAWTSKETGGDIFLAALVPPALSSEQLPPPRELVFVIDRSGSMSGEPIAQARNALKACLRSLYPTDTFRILTFDSELEWFQLERSVANDEQIRLADGFLDQVDGRGGTDILSALNAALSLPVDAQRQRYIIFLTDGAVSAEDRALAQVKENLRKARIFTFGIGPSVNRALLDKMAAFGHGWAEFLGSDEDIEGAILRFQDRIAFPLLTDLKLVTRDVKVWDLSPASLPDLYGGPALEICGRFLKNGPQPAIIIQGLADGQPVEIATSLPDAAVSVPVVRSVWAKARADTLLEQIYENRTASEKIRPQVIALSLEYGFVTPYTSFVAVDEDIVANTKPRKIRVSQPLPEGLEREGFGLVRAKMASPARLFKVMPASDISMNANNVVKEDQQGKPDWRNVQYNMSPSSFDSGDSAPARNIDPELEILRDYARTQAADGSWDQDVERTAAVLLAFVRRGKTTRKGEFRRILQKAFAWLSAQPAPAGFPAFARALALHELALSTQADSQLKAAGQAVSSLPAASSPEETLAADILSGSVPQPPAAGIKVSDLSSARMAGLAGVILEDSQLVTANVSNPLINAWLNCCIL